jgi:FkbH-like protein
MGSTKLIIWDLDDTLWEGSIMVSKDVILKNKYLNSIKSLNNHGVVSSICSNNYFDFTKNILKNFNIWDLFIMPNINYESKGLRVKSIIKDFQLRPENVCFIDDNEFNLNEVTHFNPNIKVIDGKDDKLITEFLDNCLKDNKVDNGKRFSKYKILEKKVEVRNTYGSNDEFLIDSNIIVEIREAKVSDLNRVFELVHRTNQLNYTKNRKSKSELLKDINNSKSYIIKVGDKYGDYGEVGFISYTNEHTLHFTFSCRILNMGVVDYIYHQFTLPPFNIVGEVAAEIKATPPNWIKKGIIQPNKATSKKAIMIGGCDLEQMNPYLSKEYSISTYFNYTHNGVMVHRDSIDYLKSPNFSPDIKKYILDTVPFISEKCYDTPNIKDKDIIIYSPLKDYGQGKYQSTKVPNYYISCHPFFHTNWNDNGLKALSKSRNIPLNKLYTFSEEWKPVEKPDSVFENQLNILLKEFSLSAKQVFVILGAENYYPDFNKDVFKPGERYIKYNNLVKKSGSQFNNITFINPSDYIKDRSDFKDNVRHYQRHIYKQMADDINKKLNYV